MVFFSHTTHRIFLHDDAQELVGLEDHPLTVAPPSQLARVEPPAAVAVLVDLRYVGQDRPAGGEKMAFNDFET